MRRPILVFALALLAAAGLLSWPGVFAQTRLPDVREMEWRNIGARLNLHPQSGSRYAFQFAADSQPNAEIELKGAADVDSLIVDLETLAIDADVRRDQSSSALPAQLQVPQSALPPGSGARRRREQGPFGPSTPLPLPLHFLPEAASSRWMSLSQRPALDAPNGNVRHRPPR